MHQYFHSKGLTDLDAIRKDANWRLRVGYREPEESLIHLHPRENSACELIKVPGPWILRQPEWAAYAVSVSDDHEWYTFDMLEGESG
jgi:hypothetical protein